VADKVPPTPLSPGSSFRSVHNFPAFCGRVRAPQTSQGAPETFLSAAIASFPPSPQPRRERQVLPSGLARGLTGSGQLNRPCPTRTVAVTVGRLSEDFRSFTIMPIGRSTTAAEALMDRTLRVEPGGSCCPSSTAARVESGRSVRRGPEAATHCRKQSISAVIAIYVRWSRRV
jgi:hypothetical protein